MNPYYEEAGITIYHGDCREILPQLGRFDLLLTDPPYGIGQAAGMGGGGFDGFGNRAKREPKRYEGTWDHKRPEPELFLLCLNSVDKAIVWGGNYFADILPDSTKWLVWDKQQTMPTYSDAELAWTNLSGNSVKMFRQCGAGIMAVEKVRFHPTQKPLALMKWCISLVDAPLSLLDPFMGSGTTIIASKDMHINAVGIELEENYCEIAANRLRQSVLNFGGVA